MFVLHSLPLHLLFLQCKNTLKFPMMSPMNSLISSSSSSPFNHVHIQQVASNDYAKFCNFESMGLNYQKFLLNNVVF